MTQRALVLFVLVSGVFAMAMVAFLLVEYARSSDSRKAAEWHKVHGDVVIVEGHKLRLPQDWWEKESPADGKQVFVKASRNLVKTWQSEIIVDRMGPSESKLDEDGIRKNLEMQIGLDNQRKQAPTSSLVVVVAVSTKVYCREAMIVEPMAELRCDVVGVPALITSVGLPKTEKEIEGIISTFE